jgi:hypothetical protein
MPALPFTFGETQFAFFDFDMVFLSQLANGFNVGALLYLHDKAYSVSGLATTKTFKDTFARGYGKRASLFIVKWA